ncbi:cyclic nucleotide-binding domain-containing protein [candidate division KSB1 bacterium]|nr:cyclic nucleotide-binding domain-containing protein [candidate division KSB1 bacterium]
MERDKIWYLKKFNLFENISHDELENISDKVSDNEVKKRDIVYLEGDTGENLYFLKKGRVKISRVNEAGKEITLTMLEPGEIFGELGLFDDQPRQTTATALEDSLICMMRRADFEQLMSNKPELGFKLSKLMGLRLRHFENRIDDLIFRDVPSRLARLLLRLSEQHPIETENGLKINIKLSQQELANLIGATREMTSSVLNNFRKDGIISLESKHIYIQDNKALRKIAG